MALPGPMHLSETVDIFKYPSVDPDYIAQPGDQITIGDLHANAIKLIHLLIRRQVISMDTAAFDRLVEIYCKRIDSLTREDIIEIDSIIENIVILQSKVLIRLIGDTVFDRFDDYSLYKILKKLHDAGVPVEILLSNHDMESRRYWERADRSKFLSVIIDHRCIQSGIRLLKLMNNGCIAEEKAEAEKKVEELVQIHKKMLKVISYSIKEIQGVREMTIYSHAPIGFHCIQGLANLFGIPFAFDFNLTQSDLDNNPELVKDIMNKVSAVIDAINEKFKEYVDANKVGELFSVVKLASIESYSELDAPIEKITWNRERQGLLRFLPFTFCHGHHESQAEETAVNVINLNNTLGVGLKSHCGKLDTLLDKAPACEIVEAVAINEDDVVASFFQPDAECWPAAPVVAEMHGRDNGSDDIAAYILQPAAECWFAKPAVPVVAEKHDRDNGSDGESAAKRRRLSGYAY